MIYTKTQTREAYKKLSPEVQSFIMDNETTDLISNYINQSGLVGDQANLADSEILYAMYGLQTLAIAIENISKISGKSMSDLSKLKTNLENNIFSKIPQTTNPQAKNITIDKNLENKIREVAKKYLLNEIQTSKLLSMVSANSGKMGDNKVFLETIVSDLGISKLLAEQILEDLDKRVFSYAISSTEDKKAPSSESKPILSFAPKNNPQIPEIRPQNLPSQNAQVNILAQQVNAQKVSMSTPPTTQTPTIKTSSYKPTYAIPVINTVTPTKTDVGVGEIKKDDDWMANLAEKPFIGKDFGASKITYKSTDGGETVQRPTNVPRFGSESNKNDPLEQLIKEVEKPAPQKNIMDTKLNNVTSTTTQTPRAQPKMTNEDVDAPKKYGVDPYREPLE